MAQPSYLFYDIETTGLNKCFDQIIDFAAVRTDPDLNEMNRYQIRIKLNRDSIPSPDAILTHGIGIHAMLEGEDELTAVKNIHQLMNTPHTISVGYNTLGFDDEFLRFAFYRHLLPPYTHQYANQCSRMDIYPMTAMHYLFNPEILNWPHHNGRTNLKLENLSSLNQLSSGPAHQAISDVIATVNLAKRLKTHEKMWYYLIDSFNKKTDSQRLQQLPIAFKQGQHSFYEALLVSGKLGSSANYMAPVLCLGQHAHYKNQLLWLRLDNAPLQGMTADTIAEKTFVFRRRPAEPPLLLPPNQRFLNKLDQERLQLAHNNKAWLINHPDLCQLICDYHQDFTYPEVMHRDIDAALYDIGFPSNREETLFKQFHQAKPADKEKIAEQFPNAIRREQAFRLMARHFRDDLSTTNYAMVNDYFSSTHKPNSIIDYQGKAKLTVTDALGRIADLKETNLSDQQSHLMNEYEDYLQKL